MNNMLLRIQFLSDNPVLNSNRHKELKQILENELDKPFELVIEPAPPDTMANELAVAIQALSVTVSSLALIWAIIVNSYRCSITVEVQFEDGTKMTIQKKALSEKRLQKEMENFQEEMEKKIADKKVKEILYYPNS
jgi:hypothetical protein